MILLFLNNWIFRCHHRDQYHLPSSQRLFTLKKPLCLQAPSHSAFKEAANAPIDGILAGKAISISSYCWTTGQLLDISACRFSFKNGEMMWMFIDAKHFPRFLSIWIDALLSHLWGCDQSICEAGLTEIIISNLMASMDILDIFISESNIIKYQNFLSSLLVV